MCGVFQDDVDVVGLTMHSKQWLTRVTRVTRVKRVKHDCFGNSYSYIECMGRPYSRPRRLVPALQSADLAVNTISATGPGEYMAVVTS